MSPLVTSAKVHVSDREHSGGRGTFLDIPREGLAPLAEGERSVQPPGAYELRCPLRSATAGVRSLSGHSRRRRIRRRSRQGLPEGHVIQDRWGTWERLCCGVW